MARTEGKISLTMVVGLCFSLLFFGLLSIRLDLFQEDRPAPLPITKSKVRQFVFR